ncbi:MAG: hypothetical protein C0507_05605 [Cyanobacteria bacterium PR.3.49]|jgi:hypothetical protein|nr:hypothetical protein [Cyanobacteria bacterium PR.3.49]
MSDVVLENFVEQKVTAMGSWGDYFAGSDKTAAEQLTKTVSNNQLLPHEREALMEQINKSAKEHLPNLQLINARDTDGNGKADKFDGIKDGNRVLYEQPHQQKGERHTQEEMIKELTPYLKNDSLEGSKKIFRKLKEFINDNEMSEKDLRSLIFKLEDISNRNQYPSKVGFQDQNGSYQSLDGDVLYVTRPKTSDFSSPIKR